MTSLANEIAALAAEINALSQKASANERPASGSPAPGGPQPELTQHLNDTEKLLEMLNETFGEFGEELEKYPGLTALAAFSAGLALGVVLGRQLR